MKLRILIDGTFLNGIQDGLTVYTLNNLKSLVKLYPKEFDIKIVVNKNSLSKNQLDFLLALNTTLLYSKIKPFGFLRDFQFFFLSKKYSYDVVWSPSNFCPLFIRNAIYTIHDLTYLKIPNYSQKLYFIKKIYFSIVVFFGILNAKKIICISKFTLNELKTHFTWSHERCYSKFAVVYEGVHFNSTLMREGTNFDKKKLLYVGSSRKHKNLLNLLLAFERVVELSSLNLVLAGNMKFLTSDEHLVIKRINKKCTRVNIVGYVSEGELVRLYGDSKALIFPSFYEGFGLPILEAFAYKIPVLCSNLEPFIEITNGEALFFDPHSVDAIATKILELESMSVLEYDALLLKNTERLSYFSWDLSAAELGRIFKTYNQCAG